MGTAVLRGSAAASFVSSKEFAGSSTDAVGSARMDLQSCNVSDH